MTTDLPDDITALLQAVRDALDIPMPGIDDKDERAHHAVINNRVRAAHITLNGILRDGHDVPGATDYLTECTANIPVTYAVYEAEQTGGRP